MNATFSTFVASVALVAACGFTADALASRAPVSHTRSASIVTAEASERDAVHADAAIAAAQDCCRSSTGAAVE